MIPPRQSSINHPASGSHSTGMADARASRLQGVSLNAGGETAVRRNGVIRDVGELMRHFVALQASNEAPSTQDTRYDQLLYQSMINAENQRNPGFNLAYLDGGMPSISGLDFANVEQALIRLSAPSDHLVCANIRDFDGQKSIILFDSLTEHGAMGYAEEDFQQTLPRDAKVAIFCMDQQKSPSGCHIFALSNASKLADMSRSMDRLHQVNIRGKSELVQTMTGAQCCERVKNTDLYDLPTKITPKMMKHVNALSTLKKLAAESLQQVVNKKGQTLPERMRDHLVERESLKYDGENFVHKMTLYSASIEDKRICYLGRAMDYLSTAPAEEIERLASGFRQLREDSPSTSHP